MLDKNAISKQKYDDRVSDTELRSEEYKKILNEKESAQVKIKELEALILNRKQNKYVLVKSPIDGIVESIDVTDKQSIDINRSLGVIKPIQKNLLLIFWLPNDAIPYINEGDTIKIRYKAFPFEKFGRYKGFISSISTIPASTSEISLYKKDIDVQFDPKNPLYKVEVKVDDAFIEFQNKKIEFFNGMQADATFSLENRKIYQWIFSPLYYLSKE